MEIPTSLKCTAILVATSRNSVTFQANPEGKDYGDGNWVAQWNTDVLHEGLLGYLTKNRWLVWSAKQREIYKFARESLDQHGTCCCHRAHLRWRCLQVHREIGMRIWLTCKFLTEVGNFRIGPGATGTKSPSGAPRCSTGSVRPRDHLKLSTLNKMAKPWRETPLRTRRPWFLSEG